ncbi:MAG: hypothetical protein P0Y66_21605 [Candidatus Kaistia colombiensis]|nr:MAG: hypothetical protein P0Y66_21605 [Kaistia sp.]
MSVTLTVLLDILIPGDGTFPLPSQLDLAAAMASHERFGAMAAHMIEALPGDFDLLSKDEQVEIIRRIETEASSTFDPFMVGLYSLYYVHPMVLAAVETTSGYAARAPQPDGYWLKPFDSAIVAIPAARGPQYRDAGTGTSS